MEQNMELTDAETLIEICFGTQRMSYQYETDGVYDGKVSMHNGKSWEIIYGKVDGSEEATVFWK
jgi:hypothetical protein